MSVNSSGSINWSNTYQAGTWFSPNAMIVSPYSTSELILVGQIDPDPTLSPFLQRVNDGFFLKLSTTNGSVLTFNCYGDDPTGGNGTCNYFSSIASASSPYGGANGYIVGGLSDPYSASINHYSGSWMLKLDQNGGIVWTKMIQGSGSGNAKEVSGVVERLGTSGFYEYYGVTSAGGPGNISVFKLNHTGNLYPGATIKNEFIYTGAGGGSPAYITNINAGGANDGIQVFGTQISPSYNYFVKSYFDGTSGCNESLSHINSCENGPASVINVPYSVSQGLSQYTCPSFNVITSGAANNAYQYLTNYLVTSCSANFIGTASNARETYATGLNNGINLDENIKFFPNPTTGRIMINTTTEITKIELYNSLGQFVVKIHPLKASSTDLEINLNSINIESGIYFIHYTDLTGSKVEKIVYNK